MSATHLAQRMANPVRAIGYGHPRDAVCCAKFMIYKDKILLSGAPNTDRVRQTRAIGSKTRTAAAAAC